METFKKLNQLVIGENFNGRLVLTEATIRKTRSNPPRPYLACTFADAAGTIQGNIWNYDEPEPLATGKVYDVQAQVGEYQGKKQFNNIMLAESLDQSMYEFNAAYVDNATMKRNMDMLEAYTSLVPHDGLRAFIQELYFDDRARWAAATAAVGVHHVGAGGLIAHTLEVVRLTAAMAQECIDMGYELFKSLAVTGAWLHDIGKLDTYFIDGPGCYMTTNGVLHDHIALGIRRIATSQAMQDYPEIGNVLLHLIESHHGKIEYGSPVPPRMIEAEIISRADMLSSMLDVYRQALDKAEDEKRPGNLTERVFVVNNSMLIRRGYITRAMFADD